MSEPTRNLLVALRKAFDLSRGRARYTTIYDRIEEDVRLDGIHLAQLIAAMIIASIGLNINSTEAIVGAMLICPLMGSVMAIAYSVASMDHQLMRRAVSGLVLQCVICLLTSTLYFVFSPLSNETSQLLTNSNPTIWTVIIALVGGFAGALGMSRRREPSTLIAGVAVATALMPPLCSVGYGLAASNGVLALSALYSFLVNVVFIAFGATVVLVWLKVPFAAHLTGNAEEDRQELEEVEQESRRLRKKLAAVLVVFAIPCMFYSYATVKRTIAQSGTVFEVTDTYDTVQLTKELDIICPEFVSYRVGTQESYDPKTDKLSDRIVATVEVSESLARIEEQEIEALVRLHVADADEVIIEVDDAAGK